MDFVKDILKGTVIGIANVIPGVSGGTMAVTMGIYDKMIGAINTLFKKFKENVKILFPIAIGMVIGIVGLSFILEYLLAEYPLQTNCVFIGLIVGGLPPILNRIKAATDKEKAANSKAKTIGVSHIIAFLAFFALIVGMQLLSGGEEEISKIVVDVVEVIKLFVIGIVASATMIIPGVSGSMVLMILGYYGNIIETINSTIEALLAFDISGILYGISVLLPFGIGVLVGIALIAKLITYLFEKHEKITYFAILGLIAASPIAILMNTPLSGTKIVGILVSVVCLAGGYIIARLLGEEESEN